MNEDPRIDQLAALQAEAEGKAVLLGHTFGEEWEPNYYFFSKYCKTCTANLYVNTPQCVGGMGIDQDSKALYAKCNKYDPRKIYAPRIGRPSWWKRLTSRLSLGFMQARDDWAEENGYWEPFGLYR